MVTADKTLQDQPDVYTVGTDPVQRRTRELALT
jgi:hypothetical protein